MGKLFNANFTIGHRHFSYRLANDQTSELYDIMERFILNGNESGGLDITFKETDGPSHELVQTFCIDGADVLNLFRRLREHLQKHCLDSGSRFELHEATS